jgi:Rrf2 family protein
MILGNQVEWAIHCVVLLAALPDKIHMSAKELAIFHKVPKEYLAKALQLLANAGIVETGLGPTGGYRLARLAKDISLLDIVEALEGKHSTFKCTEIRKQGPCRVASTLYAPICKIAKTMYDADEAWREVLRRRRISDLVEELNRDLPPELKQKTEKWLMREVIQ